ncbi:GDSL-type esterase/lipase family protein [Nocardiopsis gilva]|uniref:SGNH/GDSL hydrolase family protein n=1 Tax=Nocardiopsis gilva TaxID=280236 RepID=UPI0003490997|nr:GDSL-type esterase/lipase family protein [Nocardiopsis gilva]
MNGNTDFAPQLQSYVEYVSNNGELHWVPYLMLFNRPNYRSRVLTTDSCGFRSSVTAEGPCSPGGAMPDGPVNIVLGGSIAFGYGASSDAHTISSRMSQLSPASRSAPARSRRPWLNLGAPGFNSTQEALLLLLHRHRMPEIRDVVVLSGLNNLVIAGLPQPAHGYGEFFFSEQHFRKIQGNVDPRPRWSPGRLVDAIRNAPASDDTEEQAGPELDERMDIAAANTAVDLDRIRACVADRGARIHFVLQPTAPWTRKTYTPEETALFEAMDSEQYNAWELFKPGFDAAVHSPYADRLEKVCKERYIPFLDLNSAFSEPEYADRWLFVDRVHLNDDGNQFAAEIIMSRLDLS